MEVDKMIDTLDMFKGGKNSRKSKHSIIQNDLDSIRSTLFGKFYEGIIAKWLQENEGYIHQKGKPCVYWKETDHIKNSLKNSFVDKINNALKKKKENNIRTNSDGLFKKNNCYYLWEAKHWAKWNEGKSIGTQVWDLLSNSPWILAKKVKHGSEFKDIKGILFSWWQEFNEYEEMEKITTQIINVPFKFYFTSNIIDDCRKKKYGWYQKLIEEQKENIDEFFEELFGEK